MNLSIQRKIMDRGIDVRTSAGSALRYLALTFSLILMMEPGRTEDAAPEVDFDNAARMQRGIHTILSAFALDTGAFPDEPGDANANFRRLFLAKLIDDERIFGFAGDGLLMPGKPDRDIGQAPVFLNALEPGELSIAYVAGLTSESPGDLPLMVGGAGPALEWITGKRKTPPSKIYTGSVVVTFVDGRTEVMKPDPDGKSDWRRMAKKWIFSVRIMARSPQKLGCLRLFPPRRKRAAQNQKQVTGAKRRADQNSKLTEKPRVLGVVRVGAFLFSFANQPPRSRTSLWRRRAIGFKTKKGALWRAPFLCGFFSGQSLAGREGWSGIVR